MKKLLLFFALVIHAWAACPTGTLAITHTGSNILLGTDGLAFNGTITDKLTYSPTSAGQQFVGQLRTTTVTDGTLDICRVPGSYEVNKTSKAIAGVAAYSVASNWVIPTSGGPYKLSDIPASVVNTSGTTVTWFSGVTFASVAVNDAPVIAGVLPSTCKVARVISVQSLTCTTSQGTQSGVSFIDGAIERVSATPYYASVIGPPGATGATGPTGPAGGGMSGLTATALVTAASSSSIGTPVPTATMDGSGNISTPGSFTSLSLSTGATGWKLFNAASLVAKLQPVAAAGNGQLRIYPAGSSVNSVFDLSNNSDTTDTNFGRLRLSMAGSTAMLETTANGTGTQATVLNFGEQNSANSLANITFQFNGVTKANLTSAGLFSPVNLTVSGLGLGVGHLSAGGVLSSSAINLASEVTGLLPTANLAGALSATSTATIGAVVDGDCGRTTFTLTGAVLGDTAFAGSSVAFPAGVVPTAKVTATDTVAVEVCNNSEATYTVPSATYKVSILR